MTQEEKLFIGNRIVNIYKSLSILQKEFKQLKDKLTPELDSNGLVCDEGKIVFYAGNMNRRMDVEILHLILSSETGLDDQEIESIISRSKPAKFREDYISVKLN